MHYLIVIDMQNDFIDGALKNDMAKAIVPKMAERLKKAVTDGDPIIFTRDSHDICTYCDSKEGKVLPLHCIRYTHGFNINSELLDAAWENTKNPVQFIDKVTYGYPYWYDYLKPNDSVEIMGTCTEICVDANVNAIASIFPNMDITVNSKLCAGLTKEGHEAALKTMKAKLINVI